MSANIKNALKYLKSLGVNEINKTKNPDVKKGIFLDKDSLINLYKDNDKNIETYFQEDTKICLMEFIAYATTRNQKDNKRGIYQIYFDFLTKCYETTFVFERLDIPKDVSDEDVNKIIFESMEEDLIDKVMTLYPKTFKNKKIEPKRHEYLAIWMIINQIKQDKFLRKYMDDELKPSYQKIISESDKKVYDLVFENIKLIVEVQEFSQAHTDSSNDVTKKNLAKTLDYAIIYFFEDEYFADQIGYIKKFTKDIKDLLYGGLFCKKNKDTNLSSDEFNALLKTFVDYNFIEKLKENKKSYERDLIDLKKNKASFEKKDYEEKVGCLTCIIEDLDYKTQNTEFQETTHILSKWRRSCPNNEQYCIPINSKDFKRIFRNIEKISGDHMKNIYDHIFKICGENGECPNYRTTSFEKVINLSFSWNGLVRLLTCSDVLINEIKKKIFKLNTDNISGYLYEQLLSVENSCYLAIERVRIYHENISERNEKQVENYEKVIVKKQEKEKTEQVEKLQNKIIFLKKEKSELKKKLNNTMKKTIKLIDYLEKNNSIKKNALINNKIAELSKDIHNNNTSNGYKLETHTVQFIQDQSVIKEIKDFPIVYSGFLGDKVTTVDLEIQFKVHGIGEDVINKIREELGITKKSIYFYKLMLVKNDTDIKSNKQIIKKFDEDIVVKGKKINTDDSDSDFTNDSDNSNASDYSDEDSETNIKFVKYKKLPIKNKNNNKKKLVINEDSSDNSDNSDDSDVSDYESDPDNPLYKE